MVAERSKVLSNVITSSILRSHVRILLGAIDNKNNDMIDTGMSVVSVYRYSRDDGTLIEREAVIIDKIWCKRCLVQ